MKLTKTTIALAALFSCIASSNAATFLISNANDGATDTLYANSSNTLMNGGIVALGYFSSTVLVTDINTIPKLVAQLGNFTVVTSIAPGSESNTLEGMFAGYADQFPTATSIGQINVGNPLFGRVIYSIVSSASGLGVATETSEFALWQSGVLSGDTPNEIAILGSPAGVTPIIGTFDTKTGDFGGQGSNEFTTLKMEVIPEPSAALLGALGVLGLLRRRRN